MDEEDMSISGKERDEDSFYKILIKWPYYSYETQESIIHKLEFDYTSNGVWKKYFLPISWVPRQKLEESDDETESQRENRELNNLIGVWVLRYNATSDTVQLYEEQQQQVIDMQRCTQSAAATATETPSETPKTASTQEEIEMEVEVEAQADTGGILDGIQLPGIVGVSAIGRDAAMDVL